ncbi:MAG: hypothetical protein ACREA0_32975, partial [bacterium]
MFALPRFRMIAAVPSGIVPGGRETYATSAAPLVSDTAPVRATKAEAVDGSETTGPWGWGTWGITVTSAVPLDVPLRAVIVTVPWDTPPTV